MIKVIKYCIKIKIPAIRIDSKKAVERAKTKTLNMFMLFFYGLVTPSLTYDILKTICICSTCLFQKRSVLGSVC